MQISSTDIVQADKLESLWFEMTIATAKAFRGSIDLWIADAERERERLGLK